MRTDNVMRVVLVAVVLAFSLGLAQSWQNGPQTGFRFWRFDGEFFPGTGGVYFLGGRLSNGNTDGSVWSFDPISGTYDDVGVDMPTPISNYDICILRDDYDLAQGDTYGMYIVAGRLNSGQNTDLVQVYYPVTNRTRTITTDPFPGRISGNMYSAQGCAVCNNKMYVFGGLYATTFLVTNLAYVFDPLAPDGQKWTQIRNLNHSRAYAMAAVIDTLVYAVGGDTADAGSQSLIAKATCEKLNTNDTAAGWQNLVNMPQTNGEVRAFAFGFDSPYELAGKIIVAGHGQWPNEYALCFSYDVAANTWSSFPSLIAARRNHAGVLVPAIDSASGVPGMWVFGGRAANDTNVLRSTEYWQLHVTGLAETPARNRLGTVQVTPQPARDHADVSYELPAAGAVKLSILDVTGKLRLVAIRGRQDAGRQQARLDLRGLESGIYVVRIESPGRQETRKLVVR